MIRGSKDEDLEMDRVTADARSDHHWQRQPQPCRQSSKGEVRHRPVDVFLWQLIPVV